MLEERLLLAVAVKPLCYQVPQVGVCHLFPWVVPYDSEDIVASFFPIPVENYGGRIFYSMGNKEHFLQ